MGFRAFRSLSRALFRGFVRDRTALVFSLLLPVLFLALFGSLYRNTDTPRLTVVEWGQVPLLAKAGPGLGKVLDVSHTSSWKLALHDVHQGNDDAAVEQIGPLLVVRYSVADPTTAGLVQTIFASIVQQANKALVKANRGYVLLTKQIERHVRPIQFIAPGLLAWAIASGATFGAAITLVNWRHNKLLRRLRLALFLAIATTPYFGLQLTAGWWMAIPLVICGTLAFMSIGLLVGSFAKTQQAATAVANLIILPMAFLGGAFIPLVFAPSWMQEVSYAMPLRYLVTGMQDVMARGEGPAAALPDIGILLLLTAVLCLISVRVFRWDEI